GYPRRGLLTDTAGSTVAHQVQLRGDPTISGLLNQVKLAAARSCGEQEIPSESGIETLRLSAGPIFEVFTTLRALGRYIRAKDGPHVEITLNERAGAKSDLQFDIVVSLTEAADGLVGTMAYASERIERDAIERLVRCWRVLLAGMSMDVRKPISQLTLLTSADSEKILRGFNDTATPHPHYRLITELFEEQVRLTPNAIAVEHEGQRL